MSEFNQELEDKNVADSMPFRTRAVFGIAVLAVGAGIAVPAVAQRYIKANTPICLDAGEAPVVGNNVGNTIRHYTTPEEGGEPVGDTRASISMTNERVGRIPVETGQMIEISACGVNALEFGMIVDNIEAENARRDGN